MIVATFNGNPRATIIPCYSPTSISQETELIDFSDELSFLVRSIPKHKSSRLADIWMPKQEETETTNSVYTIRQTEMDNI